MEFITQQTETLQNENPFGMNLDFWHFLNEKTEGDYEADSNQDAKSEASKLIDAENPSANF